MAINLRNFDPAVMARASVDLDARDLTSGTMLTIYASTITTGRAIEVTDADALTTGSIAVFTSNATGTGTRSLVVIRQDAAAASGATPLEVWQDGTLSAIRLTGTPTKGIDLSTLTGTAHNLVMRLTTETPSATGTTANLKGFVKVLIGSSSAAGTVGYIQIYN